jgi:hypothetical protein
LATLGVFAYSYYYTVTGSVWLWFACVVCSVHFSWDHFSTQEHLNHNESQLQADLFCMLCHFTHSPPVQRACRCFLNLVCNYQGWSHGYGQCWMSTNQYNQTWADMNALPVT